MGLKERYNAEYEFKRAIEGRELKKARDIINSVRIEKVYYVNKGNKITENGEQVHDFEYVIISDNIYFYAPTSLKKIIDKEVDETSLTELNEYLTEEKTFVRFEIINLKDGHTWINTIMD